MSPRTSTRRAFLRRAGSTVLAASSVPLLTTACDSDGGEPAGAAPATEDPTESADDDIVAGALRDATRLAAWYAATIDRHGDLRPLLTGLRADVDEHVDVLTGAAGDATETPPVPTVARSARAARRRLADIEKRSVRRRRQDALDAASGELARLLASMAACHAQHLRSLDPRDGRQWASTAPDPAAVADDVSPVTDPMNDTLAGEHAAVYAYGVIGGRLDFGTAPARAATAAWEAHRLRAADLTALVEAAGEDPVAAEAGYRLPAPVDDVSDAEAVARLVEDRCAVLYASLAATTVGEVRAYAVDALLDAATRGLDWGAPTSPLPGVALP